MRAPEWRFGIILASGIILTPMGVRPAVLGNLRVGFPESLSGRRPAEVQDKLKLVPHLAPAAEPFRRAS